MTPISTQPSTDLAHDETRRRANFHRRMSRRYGGDSAQRLNSTLNYYIDITTGHTHTSTFYP